MLINSSFTNSSTWRNQEQILTAMHNAAAFGNRTIPIEVLQQKASNWNTLYKFFKANSKNTTEYTSE